MDVIGEDIVTIDQRRRSFLQSLDRQAVSSINARRPQNGDSHAVARAPTTQATLGIDTAAGSVAFRLQPAGFIDDSTGTIPVNPCCAYVNQAAW